MASFFSSWSPKLLPSPMEFQRRAEDEVGILNHKIIDHVSKQTQKIKFEDPSKKKHRERYHRDRERAINKSSLDFRWQMKHFFNNKREYCRFTSAKTKAEEEMFMGTLSDHTYTLKDLANDLAHNQYLNEDVTNQNLIDSAKKFIARSISFVHFMLEKRIFGSLSPQLGLEEQRTNLLGIEESFNEFLLYRERSEQHKQNKTLASPRQKGWYFHEILEELKYYVQHRQDTSNTTIVATALAAQANIDITELDDMELDDIQVIKRYPDQYSKAPQPPLGEIRRIEHTYCGKSSFLMDPFCSSVLEMQRRAEDMLTVFFKEYVTSGVGKGNGKHHKEVDFRDLINKIKEQYKYCDDKIEELCKKLYDRALEFAHKDHLKECCARQQKKPIKTDSTVGTQKGLRDFVDSGIQLAKLIDPQEAAQELRHLEEMITTYQSYRRIHEINLKQYKQLEDDTEKKKAVALAVLKKIESRQEEQHIKNLVVFEFYSRCKIELHAKAPKFSSPRTHEQGWNSRNKWRQKDSDFKYYKLVPRKPQKDYSRQNLIQMWI